MDDFKAVNAIYADFFGDHKPARSAVQVARLPLDALFEIEAIVRSVSKGRDACAYDQHADLAQPCGLQLALIGADGSVEDSQEVEVAD